jgi:uncharacterized protein YjbI with pentapeptide repeats
MPPPRRIGSTARPSIPDDIAALTLNAEDIADDAAFSEVSVDGARLPQLHASHLAFANARLTKVSLAESRLPRFNTSDVEFSDCNLSNARVTDSAFRSVLFSQAKLTGIHVAASTFIDVEFRNCRLELASFDKVTFKNVTFRDCLIREGDFSGVVFERVLFVDCDLSRATFSRVRAANSELRRSTMTGLRGLAQLRGIAMEPNDILANAELFAAELGIGIAQSPDRIED